MSALDACCGFEKMSAHRYVEPGVEVFLLLTITDSCKARSDGKEPGWASCTKGPGRGMTGRMARGSGARMSEPLGLGISRHTCEWCWRMTLKVLRWEVGCVLHSTPARFEMGVGGVYRFGFAHTSMSLARNH